MAKDILLRFNDEMITWNGALIRQGSSTTPASLFPTDDLVAYYRLDGDATDAFGAIDGTEVNGEYVTGIDGSAYHFTTTGGEIDIGKNLRYDYNEACSASFWLKRDVSINAEHTIHSYWAGGGFLLQEITWTTSAFLFTIEVTHPSNKMAFNTNVNSAPVDTEWHHLVWTRDNTGTIAGTNIYLDSVALTKNTLNDTLSSSLLTGDPVHQFGNYNGTTGYDGTMDEIALFNAELSQATIDEIYNSGAGVFY